MAGRAFPRGIAPLVPAIFVLQIFTLYVMETVEQLVAFGHVLGPDDMAGRAACRSAWPFTPSICVGVACAIARSRRTLAATTLRVIRLIRAIATFAVQISRADFAAPPIRRSSASRSSLPVLCTIGERAPPIVAG